MKIVTLCGTRPCLLRLSKIIGKLDALLGKDHIFIFTDQSYDDNMAGVFFRELDIREPDYHLGIGGKPLGEQVGSLFTQLDSLFSTLRPDRLLVLGDTNSALAAFIAKRHGIKVYHMEAGNRCYSDLVPEEINRRVIDSCSDVLMPYTERAKANLIREGYASQKVFVTGNPIYEVVKGAEETNILKTLKLNASLKDRAISNLTSGDDCIKAYFLVTAHRQENVGDSKRLKSIMESLWNLWDNYKLPIIFSCHANTKKRMQTIENGYAWTHMERYSDIQIHDPFSFNDFLTLERNALCVLSDSGTVQEECCIFRVPCVTLRDVTERPETIECGSNILSGVEPANVLRCVKVALSQKPNWIVPPEYLRTDVSDTVIKIVTGY